MWQVGTAKRTQIILLLRYHLWYFQKSDGEMCEDSFRSRHVCVICSCEPPRYMSDIKLTKCRSASFVEWVSHQRRAEGGQPPNEGGEALCLVWMFWEDQTCSSFILRHSELLHQHMEFFKCVHIPAVYSWWCRRLSWRVACPLCQSCKVKVRCYWGLQKYD